MCFTEIWIRLYRLFVAAQRLVQAPLLFVNIGKIVQYLCIIRRLSAGMFKCLHRTIYVTKGLQGNTQIIAGAG